DDNTSSFHISNNESNTLLFSHGNNPNNSGGHLMSINNHGVMSVGASAHGLNNATPEYKLYVEKGIRTEEVKLDLESTWPDYVFARDYQLRPLGELAQFIQQNQHLPEVPSAEEVAQDGIEVGQMQATLLKKIEELTLYILEQDQEKKVLQERLEKLEQLVENLTTQKED
ncbi:MAG: hypothetical protein AAFU64_02180, partial [Bacteroidota bacterium]